MKKRVFRVYEGVHEWNFSGLSSYKNIYITTVPALAPTVNNIRSLVRSLFPEYEIDETDMTLFEMIHSDLDIGMVSVRLKTADMFLSRSCVLMEVL